MITWAHSRKQMTTKALIFHTDIPTSQPIRMQRYVYTSSIQSDPPEVSRELLGDVGLSPCRQTH